MLPCPYRHLKLPFHIPLPDAVCLPPQHMQLMWMVLRCHMLSLLFRWNLVTWPSVAVPNGKSYSQRGEKKEMKAIGQSFPVLSASSGTVCHARSPLRLPWLSISQRNFAIWPFCLRGRGGGGRQLRPSSKSKLWNSLLTASSCFTQVVRPDVETFPRKQKRTHRDSSEPFFCNVGNHNSQTWLSTPGGLLLPTFSKDEDRQNLFKRDQCVL